MPGCYVNIHVTQTIEKIQASLLSDNAYMLFRSVNYLPRYFEPFVDQDNAIDFNGFKKKTAFFHGLWRKRYLSFIGLLPNIVAYNARESFDFFIKAFFAFRMAYDYMNSPAHGFPSVCNMIYNTKDDYFINRLIELSIAYHPTGKEEILPLFKLIEFACNDGRTQVIQNSMKRLSSQRKDHIINIWRSLDDYSHLLEDVFMDELSRHKILQSLQKTYTSIANTKNLNTNEIAKWKAMVADAYKQIENFEKLIPEKENGLEESGAQLGYK